MVTTSFLVVTEDEVIGYYKQARCIMNEARFNLRSWSSNSCCLRSVIIEDNSNDPNTIVNVLGLPQGYNFIHTKKFFISNINSTWQILRDSAQICDPLGLLAPVTVKAKIMVQILWKRKLDWDEPLDQELPKE